MRWISILFEALLDFTGISAWLNDRRQQAIGEQKQVNADLKANLAVEQRVNAAVASAPETDAEWLKAAKEGKL